MKVRGLVHIHSTTSFDGTLSLEELRACAMENGFQFVLVTEHIENLSRADLDRLIAECARLSDDRCLLVPGLEIEDQCQYFIGMNRSVETNDYVVARRQLIESGAFVVLAHPHRLRRQLSDGEAGEIEAIEVWNVKDDGFRAPGFVGLSMWRNWNRNASDAPWPIGGLDLHASTDFRPLGIEMDLVCLSTGEIVAGLRKGRFQIWRSGVLVDLKRVTGPQRAAAYCTWMMRRLYRQLSGTGQLLPIGLRQRLKRLIKG